MANQPQLPKKQDENSSKNNPSGFGLGSMKWAYLFFSIMIVMQIAYLAFGDKSKQIPWSEFEQGMLARHDIESIIIVNQEEAEVYIKKDKLGKPPYEELKKEHNGPHYLVAIGSIENFEKAIASAEQDIPPADRMKLTYLKRTDWTSNILSWVLPLLLLIGLWWFIMSRVRGGAGGINPMDFGKTTAVLFKKDTSNVTFEDIAGLEEVKVEVREVVDFLKNPTKYTSLGAKIPKGVLLVGPPGTGKTLLARAVAGEAGVPFFSMSGSEFVEMFVGVGASRVRDLFRKAKDSAPSIIFIDEIDAVGRSRGRVGAMMANDERENTLNQLLAEMDGFGANTGVIVLAATNRGEILDRALLRPGRFDRQIYLDLPTLLERRAIFGVHTKPLKLDDDINLDTLAAQTPGFSGADIANICNEAALIAARHGKEAVVMQDFYDATDRVIAGLEKKSKILSDKEKKIVAWHEAGHATASWFLPNADTLLKVSIVPRGKSLGAAWYLPQEQQIYTTAEFEDRICAALAGRAAEEVVFGEVSSGALDDLEKVTKQAYLMVSCYGLDKEIGNISFYDSTGRYEQMLQKPYSEATAQKIDEQASKLVESAYERTKVLLRKHRTELDALAQRLLEKEVVFQQDLEAIFGERPPKT
ncbi:MAG: ATP-dependent zinc metalloprotease FtsH [Saprospiraceae bacterium]|nr:ATP-dependent zinc metalloprotease FtsH [Saprospiraceae bacterium]MCF8250231.1 ATP-dependent zinc metalloprotease FtsH [Saprospiraceae bacterium]MCF8312039.1 ATP-dependent zinc metalloprotease FtsH [Saprospiraceae bacterium]MCF8441136.1 ATP-dependent zinc metalloprotease FtsH [Saprospiraceae bacterium]